MTVPDRSRAFSTVLWAFSIRKTVENAHKTIENARERSGTLRNGERSGAVNGQEHLGTIESERSNALERIVENGHGTFTVRSRSRIKNERNTVIIFNNKYQIYNNINKDKKHLKILTYNW
jgi:hypothetical protein